jgi:glycosyltransferase involved in cell wall biosynthesis
VPLDPEDRLMSYRHLLGLTEQLRQENFDLIHIQTPFVAHYAGLELGRRLGLRCVETYHTYFEEYFHHYIPFLPRRLVATIARHTSRRQCNAVDALIVPSPAMRDALVAYGITTPQVVIPTGIPVDHFAQGQGQRFRERHGLPADRPLLLYVGRVAFEKNIGFLLDCMAQLRHSHPEALLLITGEGPAEHALQRQVKHLELDEQVRFLGYLDRSLELPDCYAAADAFVFASRTETQGLVLIEAMAAGTPVIALAEMGTKSILDAGQGCLTPPPDIHHFTQAIRDFLNFPPLRQRLAAEARQYASTWSAEALTGTLHNFYRRLAYE